ncbi:MAG: TRAP transporter large permease subunit [Xanthobacteraceae bacterium]|nr:TRAP transporter large permease subunit [Xanthobacteraceae bacterium]
MIAWTAQHLALLMFAALGVGLFCGFPVGFVLGGIGVLFGALGVVVGAFEPIQFLNLPPRLFGAIAANPVLVAIPMFIFMGTVLEKSGIAQELLACLQVLTRRVPGGLAMSVTLMGTIMAATTGIVGASVIMLTLIALPAMLERRYGKELAVGTIASAGTLGILIPPSIMLVVMGDLLQVSVGTLFAAALVPGLILSGLYLGYIAVTAVLNPTLAPPLPAAIGPKTASAFARMILRSFLPPVFLVALVLGSIFGGWATPTEAAGVGSFGALLLAALRGALRRPLLREVTLQAGLTNAMVFLLFFGTTLFAYVFRALGGDDMVREVMRAGGLDTAWEILVFVQLLVFGLGFFFDWIEISLIVLPVFAPMLQGLDFSQHLGPGPNVVFLTWFVITLAVNLQTSFLTPPFGFTLFCMRGTLPPEVGMASLYRGIVPFVLLQLAGLALVIAVPDLVLWLPRRAGLLN